MKVSTRIRLIASDSGKLFGKKGSFKGGLEPTSIFHPRNYGHERIFCSSAKIFKLLFFLLPSKRPQAFIWTFFVWHRGNCYSGSPNMATDDATPLSNFKLSSEANLFRKPWNHHHPLLRPLVLFSWPVCRNPSLIKRGREGHIYYRNLRENSLSGKNMVQIRQQRGGCSSSSSWTFPRTRGSLASTWISQEMICLNLLQLSKLSWQ